MAVNNITGFPGQQTQRSTDGSQVQVKRTDVSAAQAETGKSTLGDTVSLTDTATRMRSLENTLANLPVVDSQRVEDIQRAIASGDFEIDAERLAGKMIHFERQLAG